MHGMHVDEIACLDGQEAENFVQVVGSLEATQRGILGEVEVHEDDVEATHGEDRVVAESAERIQFYTLVQ